MTDLVFIVLALLAACVVILGWRRVHREHQRLRALKQDSQPVRSQPPVAFAVSTDRAAAGWSVPLPEHVPRPTYWPAVLALGLTWTAWGAVSSYLLSLVGVGIFVLALTFWMREMRHAEGADRTGD